jgi:methionine-rich copper-binding protein CopC
LVTLLAVLWWGSGYAVAHSRLLSVAPADGARLTEAPTQVVLTFNEDVLPEFVTVRVTDGGGVARTRGEPTVEGAVVTQRLATGLGPGAYRVTYKVVSADSHPISGTTDFTVADDPATSPSPAATPRGTGTASATEAPTGTATRSPAATAAGSTTPRPTPTASPVAQPAPSDTVGSATAWLAGGAVLAAAGIGGVLYARSRRGSPEA